ncbi:MAG TPA: tRNA guanosine(34) transglycosylase Tgt [Alphaproteobacteria bacterium]|jgi:queuine tRNA-ribosyltransferase
MSLKFTISHRDAGARRGQVMTAHGPFETPAFMPVGTAGTVKGMMPRAVASTGAQIVLGNTYHLMLRPTAETVAALGGLHKLMDWRGPILTDSGGFQVMSLKDLRKVSEQGVVFKSHLDGSKIELTPERSMEVQHLLDSDITMAFDECIPWPAEEAEAARAMHLSMRWAERSKAAFKPREGYGLFGINQGGGYMNLRAESAQRLSEIGFDGYAVGGLAVGEPQAEMFETLEAVVPLLPDEAPHYLMGVGTPSDIVGAVKRGIDMFDCVMPTRSGRTAKGFTHRGEINIRNARHARDPRPLDADCGCPLCGNHSRGYLHHLFKANEMLGPILLSWHNIQFYQDMMKGIRAAIEQGGLDDFAAAFLAKLDEGDIPEIST